MLDKVQSMQVTCTKYLDEIGVKLGDCLRIFEQGQSLEEIQILIRKFQGDVEQDTNRRATISIKKKGGGEFGSRRSSEQSFKSSPITKPMGNVS